MSITSQLVERLIATDFAGLPAEAVDMAKQVCLDGIAVMIAGAREPLGAGRITLDYTRELGGTPEASVVAGAFRTSAVNAAYANGTLCHALDFDNTSVPVNHPTSAVAAGHPRDCGTGEAERTRCRRRDRSRVRSAGPHAARNTRHRSKQHLP